MDQEVYIKKHVHSKYKHMVKKKKHSDTEIKRRLNLIEAALQSITYKLERSHFYDYIEYASSEKRIIRRAFFVGVLKGLGTAIGFSLIGAIIIYILNLLAMSNLPYIADFIAEIIDIIESK